jgi:peptide/nickel transport system substrate-binding protein
MSPPRRILPALVSVLLVAGACGSSPVVTGPPASGAVPVPSGGPPPTEIPFAPAAWPVAGSACGDPALGGRLGRIEAPDATTVRFTLCAPDGAFLARLAHPSLGIVDASWIARLAADRGAARGLPGTGPYRIDAWSADNVRLARADPAGGGLATVVIRWAPAAADRVAALLAASVDGIDSPDPGAVAALDTQPEVAVLGRPGLSTAYLGFGSGPTFARTRVRRAIGTAIDHDALAAAAFGPGAIGATHTAPCVVEGGCEGRPWPAFDAPSAVAALAGAGFNLKATYALHVPDAPMPGLADPAAAAAAVAAQLRANVGLTVTPDVIPAATFAADLAAGRLDGLFLAGIASPLADASGYLEPLFGSGVASSAAARATGVAADLAAIAGTAGAAARRAAFAGTNDAIRAAAPIVPLVHAGTVSAYRADVTGAATSPLGVEALGSFTPGDRHQLVFLGASEPAGAWCGDQDVLDALRLCGLVTEGLYGYAPGTLEVEPRLATRCAPDETTVTWTCSLRPDVRFHDGMRLDAGDVLASLVARWDPAGPMRTGVTAGSFAAWDALFGGAPGR